MTSQEVRTYCSFNKVLLRVRINNTTSGINNVGATCIFICELDDASELVRTKVDTFDDEFVWLLNFLFNLSIRHGTGNEYATDPNYHTNSDNLQWFHFVSPTVPS